jgi:hypothetical protein
MAVLVLFLAVSCGGDDHPATDDRAAGLADLALRGDEVPSGLELNDETSGTIDSLRDVLPPRSDAPGLPTLPKPVRRGFLGAYDAVYRGDQDGGPAEVTSSVIRFTEEALATAFLTYLRAVQSEAITVGSPEIVETPGLGEEGYGWHRRVPDAETSGTSWRRDDLVFTLTLSGALGEAPVQRAVELARRMDSRLG